MKKMLRISKFLLIGSLWSFCFLYFAAFEMSYFWNFNILSGADWEKISYFWNHGGIIKKQNDVLFMLNILILPFLWIYIWRKLLKTNFLNLILWPFNAFNRWHLKKLEKASKRIILRNIQSSAKEGDELKTKIESIKPQPAKEKEKIRQNLASGIAGQKKFGD